jgi:hypothetical protein
MIIFFILIDYFIQGQTIHHARVNISRKNAILCIFVFSEFFFEKVFIIKFIFISKH